MSELETSHEAASPAEAVLDESSITSSLSRLQEMHIALRNLRDTIPRVMDAVLVEPLAPEQLQLRFAQAAKDAAAEMKSFALVMKDESSEYVMEKAKKSRAKDGENIRTWLVTEHEDWLDVKRDGAIEGVELDGDDSDTKLFTAVNSSGDIGSTLEKFKESRPGIEASLEDATKTIKIYLPPPAHIHFELQPSSEIGAGYELHSKEKTKLHSAIVEAISARPMPKDLGAFLEMLASYGDVKSGPCVKCSRLLDPNAQFPVVRSRKQTKQANGQYMDHWEAFHSACL